jgi:predicted RNA-binding Zn ribbon-like protein
VNTTNRENGAERFDDPVGLDEWLVAEGRPPVGTDAAGLATVLALRAVLNDLAVANHDAMPDAAAWRRLEDLAAGAPMVLVVPGDGPTWKPVAPGVAGLVGEMIAIVAEAWVAGTWPRLKACSNSHCRWMFWDRSRSRTGVWCSMSACGQRDKQRQYRRRFGTTSPG